jgi:lysophospholipase L1-like esterase
VRRVLPRVIGALLALAACSADRDPSVAPSSTTTAVAGSAVPPTVPAIPVDSVAMVGDSITVGSMEALEQQFATLDLDDLEIDAESGRRMLRDDLTGSGMAAVSEIVDDGPPDLWVIALGTNDVANYGPDEYRPAIAELLAEVPADAPLVWVDTYLDEFPEESAAFNAELRAALAERGRATVVDWSAIAPDDGVLFDGVHPSGYGIEQFATRVVGAVDQWMA